MTFGMVVVTSCHAIYFGRDIPFETISWTFSLSFPFYLIHLDEAVDNR